MRLAVGIPSYHEADSISHVVTMVDEGLACLAESSDCVIVNVDSASPDRTSEVFLNTPTRCRKESFVIGEQPRGKGRNVLRFFLQQLIPAFIMRVVTSWDDNWRRAAEQVEEEIREQADLFGEKLLARTRRLGKAD